jgi:CHASE3 domain sensor protein
LEAAAYRRLLLRLLALPIIALGLLALTLAYALQQVQLSARRVDHADQVIAHANNLLRLIVDEETGLRGFFHTRDQAFLEPYRKAKEQLDPEFQTLFGLVHDPAQVERLKRLQAASQKWQEESTRTIAQPTPANEQQAHMLERKIQMDQMRSITDEFLSAELIWADRSRYHSGHSPGLGASPSVPAACRHLQPANQRGKALGRRGLCT